MQVDIIGEELGLQDEVAGIRSYCIKLLKGCVNWLAGYII